MQALHAVLDDKEVVARRAPQMSMLNSATDRMSITHDDDREPVALNIDPGKVCFIILKAREFDAKVDPVEPDPGSNAADDGERAVLEGAVLSRSQF